jgi:tRNA pseudouridine38-40 synthase
VEAVGLEVLREVAPEAWAGAEAQVDRPVAAPARREPAAPAVEVGVDATTVLLTVAYDGRPYSGFAMQPGVPTVAGALLDALRELDPSIDRLRAVSRTDAGVHARDQRVAFDTARELPMRAWVLAVTRHLPESVTVRGAALVPRGYDPRAHVLHKRYRYLLDGGLVRDPLMVGRVWRVEGIDAPEAAGRMQHELDASVGTHDFAAFASARDTRPNTERTIIAANVTAIGEQRVAVDISGDGFLHNMVRILVGTAVDVARDRLEPGAVARALSSRDRRDGGITAPPDGLYLESVTLDSEAFEDRWP